MRNSFLVSSFVLLLAAVGGCNPAPTTPDAAVTIDTGATDAGLDSGGTDSGASDSGGTDAGEDSAIADAGADVGPVDGGTGLCIAYGATLGGGLGRTIGDAVAACGRGTCVSCALAGGTGASCGDGGTMTSCVLDCIEANEFGSCAAGTCDAGETCDGTVCRNDAATAVNAALLAGDVDLACTSCFAGISQCVVANDCALDCLAGGCACDTCQCDNDCPADYDTCSGLGPYLDCAMVASMCT